MLPYAKKSLDNKKTTLYIKSITNRHYNRGKKMTFREWFNNTAFKNEAVFQSESVKCALELAFNHGEIVGSKKLLDQIHARFECSECEDGIHEELCGNCSGSGEGMYLSYGVTTWLG